MGSNSLLLDHDHFLERPGVLGLLELNIGGKRFPPVIDKLMSEMLDSDPHS